MAQRFLPNPNSVGGLIIQQNAAGVTPAAQLQHLMNPRINNTTASAPTDLSTTSQDTKLNGGLNLSNKPNVNSSIGSSAAAAAAVSSAAALAAANAASALLDPPALTVGGGDLKANIADLPPVGAELRDSGSSAIGLPNAGGNWDNSREQQCCLMENGRRCNRTAGNASYNKRIANTVKQKKLGLHMDPSATHNYICDYHKNVIQTWRTKRKRNADSDADSGETDSAEQIHHSRDHPEVDLYQMQLNTLRRYKKHFKVPCRPGLNKALLADSMMRHFKTIPVVEKETLTFFIYMIKTNRSKFDRERRDEAD